jgi:hypothetical protein
MDSVIRVLTVVFWITAALTALWLAVNLLDSAAVADLFGNAGASFVYTLLLGTMALCSGTILWYEWRNNPVEESEYGEWTNRQLFHAIVFCITFFVGFISFANWLFSL